MLTWALQISHQVRETTLEVEFPLIEDQLEEIDVILQKAEKDLTWNSAGVWEYIKDTRYTQTTLNKKIARNSLYCN